MTRRRSNKEEAEPTLRPVKRWRHSSRPPKRSAKATECLLQTYIGLSILLHSCGCPLRRERSTSPMVPPAPRTSTRHGKGEMSSDGEAAAGGRHWHSSIARAVIGATLANAQVTVGRALGAAGLWRLGWRGGCSPTPRQHIWPFGFLLSCVGDRPGGLGLGTSTSTCVW